MKIDTLFKAQTWKWDPIKGKNKQLRIKRFKHTNRFKSLSLYSNVKFSFNRWFVSHVARHLYTWILADIMIVPVAYLRIKPGAQHNKGKNDTLFTGGDRKTPHPVWQRIPV